MTDVTLSDHCEAIRDAILDGDPLAIGMALGLASLLSGRNIGTWKENRESNYDLAYKMGWINCAKWAGRVDLMADMDSQAFQFEMAADRRLAMMIGDPK